MNHLPMLFPPMALWKKSQPPILALKKNRLDGPVAVVAGALGVIHDATDG